MRTSLLNADADSALHLLQIRVDHQSLSYVLLLKAAILTRLVLVSAACKLGPKLTSFAGRPFPALRGYQDTR